MEGFKPDRYAIVVLRSQKQVGMQIVCFIQYVHGRHKDLRFTIIGMENPTNKYRMFLNLITCERPA